MKVLKKIMLRMIRFYQQAISPLRPRCCNYIPTCSQYAVEAIEKYGPLKGGWMALLRYLPGWIPAKHRWRGNFAI